MRTAFQHDDGSAEFPAGSYQCTDDGNIVDAGGQLVAIAPIGAVTGPGIVHGPGSDGTWIMRPNGRWQAP